MQKGFPTTNVDFSPDYPVGEREAPRDRMLTPFCEGTHWFAPALVLRYLRGASQKSVVLAMGWGKLSFSFWRGDLTAGASLAARLL
jgi:hypothetical protein